MVKRSVLTLVVSSLVVILSLTVIPHITRGAQRFNSSLSDTPGIALAARAEIIDKPFVGEAGIAAYTQFVDSLTLQPVTLTASHFMTIKSKLSLVRTLTADYIQGIFNYYPYYASTMAGDMNVYAEKSGLVVSYLPKGIPSSQIITGKAADYEIVRLLETLQILANALGFKLGDVRYYHFSYPDATWVTFANREGSGTLKLSVPSNVNFLEASWYAVHGPVSYYVSVNDSIVARNLPPIFTYNNYYYYFGFLDKSLFSPGATHTFKVQLESGGYPADWGFLLIYKTS